ncbi:mitochondrial uncoupling protein 4-like [Sycon ciliatum]|uniref:mitochondrial uncoupling protein 4-like n=1 Tax=Sycon ciliatum TaxID=27933 RepID=UPI0020AB74F5|eukprot:scpid67061/ scgid9613/ Mitochondrial uncoupling protein 4; Solute carrier family 25 member 27
MGGGPRVAESVGIAPKMTLSVTASIVAETVTFPLDLTKTRLMIQGERGKLAKSTSAGAQPPTAYRGMMKTAIGIASEEGVLKLWQGVTPALLRHCVYASRLPFYEVFREKMSKRDAGTVTPVWKCAIAGMAAGCLAQFLASPNDLVKVRMQMEGRRLLEGKEPRVRGVWHAYSTIVKLDGVRGLWKGWVPNVQRAALVNMGDLTTYDSVKHRLLESTSLQDNAVTHAIASGCSGLVAAVVSTPADVVKTRMMNQPVVDGRGTLYSSSADCLLQTVRQEGFFALYKGFLPIWYRMAPWSLTFWLSYEQVRKMSGVPSF